MVDFQNQERKVAYYIYLFCMRRCMLENMFNKLVKLAEKHFYM